METWGKTTCEIANWNNEKGVWLEIVKVNENVYKLFDSNSIFWKSSFSGFFLCIITLQVCNSKLKHISSKFWFLSFILLISLLMHHLFYPFKFLCSWGLSLNCFIFNLKIRIKKLKKLKNQELKIKLLPMCNVHLSIKELNLESQNLGILWSKFTTCFKFQSPKSKLTNKLFKKTLAKNF